jgi:hypothetical protein
MVELRVDKVYEEDTSLFQLGIMNKILTIKEIKEHTIQSLVKKSKSFDWIHLGETDLKIGRFLNLIRNEEGLLPPRTGHLGNWEEIVSGRAGMMDFNKAICTNQYGYPLLYCFNQTEDENLTQGDWVYLPGSLIENGQRKELDLYTWNGSVYAKRARTKPMFTPFVQTRINGELVSLVEVHKEKLKSYEDFLFKTETSLIIEHQEFVKRILKVLIESAKKQKNSRRALQDLFSHAVSLDGKMERTIIEFNDNGYQMGSAHYESTSKLIEAALLPYHAVENPKEFFGNIQSFPESMPLFSNILSGVLSAILESHYPFGSPKANKTDKLINFHFHWGARDMAGFPPIKKGYFAEKSTRKSYRQICNVLIKEFKEISPIYFLLIPSVIFSLCPTNIHEKDKALLSLLFKEVINQRELENDYTDIMKLVERWFNKNKGILSDYFNNRFRSKSGILQKEELNVSSSIPLEPEMFRELTFREACIIVGALHELHQST